MTERQKINVVASADNTSTGFNFNNFEKDFYPQGGAGGPGHGNSPAGGEAASRYANKRTPIVAGVSSGELIMQHRRSLAGLADGEPGDGAPKGAELDALTGVTLSRRHTFTQEEYDSTRSQGQYDKLDEFKGFEGQATSSNEASPAK